MILLVVVVLTVVYGQVSKKELEKQKIEMTEKFEKEKEENQK